MLRRQHRRHRSRHETCVSRDETWRRCRCGGAIVNIASVAARSHSRLLLGTPAPNRAVDRMTRVAREWKRASLVTACGSTVSIPGLSQPIWACNWPTTLSPQDFAPGRRRRRRLGCRADAAWPGWRGRRHGRRRCFPLLQRGALSSLVPACRSTGAWACKSPNPKNRNSGEYEHEREKGLSSFMASLATRGVWSVNICGNNNIPFIAAGRDAAKVKAVVEKIPGIENRGLRGCEVEHTHRSAD